MTTSNKMMENLLFFRTGNQPQFLTQRSTNHMLF